MQKWQHPFLGNERFIPERKEAWLGGLHDGAGAVQSSPGPPPPVPGSVLDAPCTGSTDSSHILR